MDPISDKSFLIFGVRIDDRGSINTFIHPFHVLENNDRKENNECKEDATVIKRSLFLS
jgi:hypothetical protein